jgi:acetyl-CoA acetyltransferase
MTDAYIPYGGYWSTPFAKWQGTLSHLNSVELAAHVAKDELQRREIDAAGFDMAILGITVPQYKSFYGAPWMTGMMGADRVTGPTIAQACATSARCLQNASQEIDGDTADNNAFQKRYMRLPFEVPDQKFRKTVATMTGDEGVFETTRDGLNTLKPVVPGGTVTFGSQTHPADGNTAMIVTTREKAREMSSNPSIEIRLAGFGQARTDKAFMPHAPVPASQRALANAGISLDDVTAVKTHNPFAVNDIVFCRETGFDITRMNNYGCSLIWGHPQGPTGLRAICELIEELVIRGGGYGLFNGCAAGDSSVAAVIEIRDAA